MGNEREAAELSAAIIILSGVNLGPSDRSKLALQTRRQGREARNARPRERKA